MKMLCFCRVWLPEKEQFVCVGFESAFQVKA